jgi:chromosomal replication initiation ATPase DnaA
MQAVALSDFEALARRVGQLEAQLLAVLPGRPLQCVPAIPEIVRVVCSVFGVSVHDIYSDRRPKKLADPRCAIALLAREMTPHSYPQIGTVMRRDHSTVMWSVQRAHALMLTDPAFMACVQAARAMLGQRA